MAARPALRRRRESRSSGIPNDKSLASMMVNNELDVASVHRAFSRESNIVDRSTQIRARGGDWSKVKPLFPDIIEEGTRSSRNMATSRRTTPTRFAATLIANIPGWHLIYTRRWSPPKNGGRSV